MSDSPDTNLQLKKRARRRLVGAIAFAGLAAVVLPMIMDEEPKQQVQDVQIRIPGQEHTPFEPKLPAAAMRGSVAAGSEVQKDGAKEVAKTAPVSPNTGARAATDVPVEKEVEKKQEKSAEKSVAKAAEKTLEKATEKALEKTAELPAKTKPDEPQRAAAILSGKTVEPVAASAAAVDGQFVILIGAFSNQANVKQLQTKIGELGVKVYTEVLESPDGKKTRVRAGPFPNRAAAEKALTKLKTIGVNGTVAARQ